MIAEIQNTITAAPGRCGFQLNEDHPINQASTFAPGRCGFQPHRIQSKPVGAGLSRCIGIPTAPVWSVPLILRSTIESTDDHS